MKNQVLLNNLQLHYFSKKKYPPQKLILISKLLINIASFEAFFEASFPKDLLAKWINFKTTKPLDQESYFYLLEKSLRKLEEKNHFHWKTKVYESSKFNQTEEHWDAFLKSYIRKGRNHNIHKFKLKPYLDNEEKVKWFLKNIFLLGKKIYSSLSKHLKSKYVNPSINNSP